MKGNYPPKTCIPARLPRFYYFGGGVVPLSWAFGWETGRDSDLICIRPNVQTRTAEYITLSPICSNRVLAFCAFITKVLLVRIDHNLRGLEG
ncbi:hypothetical protein ES703_56486 [subsurface metagenome]